MPELSQLVRPAHTALAGGQAPACWRREVARRTARRDDVERGCSWIEALTRVRPRLRDKPLLGECLAALTGEPSRPVEPQPEERPSRRFQPVWSQPQAGVDRGRVSSGAPPEADPLSMAAHARPAQRGSAETPIRPKLLAPMQLEPRAHRTLLRRLAGEPPAAERPRSSKGEGSGQRLRRRSVISDRGTASRPVDKPETPPLVSIDDEAQTAWLYDLAQRAGCSMHDTERGSHRTHRARRHEQDVPEKPSRTQLGRGTSSALAQQWSTPLPSGSRVSRGLLAHLAGRPGRHRRPPDTQPEAARRHTPDGQSPGLAAAADASGGYSQTPGGPATSSPDPWSRLAGKAVQEGGSSREVKPANARDGAFTPDTDATDIGDGVKSSAGIAPPTVVSSLPALLPSQRVGVPSPPVASAVSERGARQEEVAQAGDDLAELAAKVKRILDEQARRHGIDV